MDRLRRVANYLILNSSYKRDVGLYDGKMGVVLFFVHYARYTNEKIYAEYAEELLDEVIGNLHSDSSINFSKGLCGIGWAILHLLQIGFIQGNPDEILSEIDREIEKRHLEKIKDRSLHSGTKGIYYYLMKRRKMSKTKIFISESKLFNKEKMRLPDDKEVLLEIAQTFTNDFFQSDEGLKLNDYCNWHALKEILR